MPRVPRLLSGPSVKSLNLSEPEAYLLSRVDGTLDEQDLALVTGMTPPEATEVLERLALLGAVELLDRAEVKGSSTGPASRAGGSRPVVTGAPGSGARPAVSPPLVTHPIAASPRYDPAELDEVVELELDKKRRLLDMFYGLDDLTYYELLGVDGGADKKHIKSAYYALAPEFHPDKYFRKQLGSFKHKIEVVFARITLAHDVLTTPARRAEYDDYLAQTHKNRAMAAQLDAPAADVTEVLAAVERAAAQALAAAASAPPAAPAPGFAAHSSQPSNGVAVRSTTPAPSPNPHPAAPPAPSLSPEEVLRQRREALARKLAGGRRVESKTSMPAARAPQPEMDPAIAERAAEAVRLRQEAAVAEATRAQVARHLDAGRAALDRQDYAGAANAYRIAASLAPDDAAVQATCNEAVHQAAVALADGYWKQALYEEGQERWGDAALSYSKVCTGRPDDALAHERVAFATLKSSTNARRAVEFARRAIEIDPRKPEFHVTLARAYTAAGLEKSAASELDRALALAPKDAKVQALVSAARNAAVSAGAAGNKAPSVAPPSSAAPASAPKDPGTSRKASGLYGLVTAVRTAIAPKEGK